MKSTDTLIAGKIKRAPRGTLFFPENFTECGSSGAVRLALHRLIKKGEIVRVAQGIYVLPKEDKLPGKILPTLDEIALTIAKRDRARVVPTGVQALNRLGLSTQVPMNVVYLTDGAARKIKVGKRSIHFKRATPKNLSAKGEISSLVIQALRAIGKDKVTEAEKEKVLNYLNKEKRNHLMHDMKLAPVWIAEIMKQALKPTR
jgi:hypothetical protein